MKLMDFYLQVKKVAGEDAEVLFSSDEEGNVVTVGGIVFVEIDCVERGGKPVKSVRFAPNEHRKDGILIVNRS